ncbi:MAG: bifunctional DNA-formamidopyrimidine glycosylase/DNA-(apurinic or apyrimidinic site) lyase [Ardenticatenales bacterium]
MPELPEVETYARDLALALPGRRIVGARIGWPRQAPRNTAAEMDARVRGQRIVAVGRRGKYICVELTDDWLIIHLKMSGRLQIAPAASPPNRHAHTVFALDGGDELRFHDSRKFGRVYLVANPADVTGRLGPEPLDDAFTLAAFAARIGQRRGRLKPLLLDQTFVAGLGNIYADEALFAAGLHPLRTADTLTDAEVGRLHGAIRDVLAKGVALRGTSFSAGGYRDLTGNLGEMQGTLAVFRRTGQPCPRCSTPIERLVVGGRSTHVCPRCQKAS